MIVDAANNVVPAGRLDGAFTSTTRSSRASTRTSTPTR
jgi:hypothetical protein